MKKALFTLVAVMLAAGASAQLVQSTTVIRAVKPRTSYTYIDLSVGTPTWKDANGNAMETDDTAFGVNVGYRQFFGRYVAWDIFGMTANILPGYYSYESVSDIPEADPVYVKTGMRWCLGAITGVRGVSPAVVADISFFAGAGVGYAYDAMSNAGGGMVWEIKAGVNLTRWLNLAYRYSDVKVGDTTASVSGVNLGFQF
jgi:hypothetical protein